MLRDERAVSPVVAAALLIGITALLGTAVGLAMFGTDLGASESPEVTLSFGVDDGEIVVRHEGGDSLDPDVAVALDEAGTEYELVVIDGNGNEVDEELTAGGRAVLEDADGNRVHAADVEEISVVWRNPRPGNDAESVLGTFQP